MWSNLDIFGGSGKLGVAVKGGEVGRRSWGRDMGVARFAVSATADTPAGVAGT